MGFTGMLAAEAVHSSPFIFFVKVNVFVDDAAYPPSGTSKFYFVIHHARLAAKPGYVQLQTKVMSHPRRYFASQEHPSRASLPP
jgi:hypothetical protein